MHFIDYGKSKYYQKLVVCYRHERDNDIFTTRSYYDLKQQDIIDKYNINMSRIIHEHEYILYSKNDGVTIHKCIHCSSKRINVSDKPQAMQFNACNSCGKSNLEEHYSYGYDFPNKHEYFICKDCGSITLKS
jgi:hypothetical protein